MLDQITPVLLTFNDAPNVGRTLSHLRWAKDIVVVDSGSTDETIQIVKHFPNTRLFVRLFDNHANQWRCAVMETAIVTPWILRLDADYQLTSALLDEIRALDPKTSVSAYRISFDYAIFSAVIALPTQHDTPKARALHYPTEWTHRSMDDRRCYQCIEE
jgi:glycosyltransferase involved in cell wall biosynthesis